MDLTPCKDCTICPLIAPTLCGQYLAALEYVNPGPVSKFPFLIDLSHVDLTGNPDEACIYRTSDSMIGRS